MYCLDTYALWEIMKGNKKYLDVVLSNFVITDWTLVEFYKTLIKEYDKRTAEYWLRKFKPYTITVNINILKKAVDFHHEHKKNAISLFDAVGYIFSVENKMEFVTGDKEFRNKPQVNFIK
ncbi:MAG: hypothetical protein ACMXYE_02265 [Candidatus Woesearchaeota archaeon]